MDMKIPHQPRDREEPICLLANCRGKVRDIFAFCFAVLAAHWMPRPRGRADLFFPMLAALIMTACTKGPPVAGQPSTPAPTAPAIAAEPAPVEASAPAEPLALAPQTEPSPGSEQVDVFALERRFLASSNDPQTRIEVIQELANAAPAAALTMMNRLFPLERREDVKMEMLSALNDLDHERDRDNQLALCNKALAATQPMQVRYVAVQVLTDLGDPRARSLLQSLKTDRDPEIRAAAVQALHDLGF
jgi:hypothetical protein